MGMDQYSTAADASYLTEDGAAHAGCSRNLGILPRGLTGAAHTAVTLAGVSILSTLDWARSRGLGWCGGPHGLGGRVLLRTILIVAPS